MRRANGGRTVLKAVPTNFLRSSYSSLGCCQAGTRLLRGISPFFSGPRVGGPNGEDYVAGQVRRLGVPLQLYRLLLPEAGESRKISETLPKHRDASTAKSSRTAPFTVSLPTAQPIQPEETAISVRRPVDSQGDFDHAFARHLRGIVRVRRHRCPCPRGHSLAPRCGQSAASRGAIQSTCFDSLRRTQLRAM
jgi:hypothetical protein